MKLYSYPTSLAGVVLTALQSLQTLSPGAGISGGYLRDGMHGKERKDIDVFCGALTPDTRACLPVLFPDAKLEPYTTWVQYASAEVESVWYLGDVDGLPLQLIELRSHFSPADRFTANDFGICQMFDDGKQLLLTDSAVFDVACEQFTLTTCENQMEFDRSMSRWERLHKKYPDHTLVIPEEFRKYQDAKFTI